MKIKTSVRVDEALWERVSRAAQERGQTQTVFVERALEAALAQGAAGMAAMDGPLPAPDVRREDRFRQVTARRAR